MKSGEITEAAFCTMERVNVRHNTQANYNVVLNIIRKEPMVDGYTGFLFLDKKEKPRRNLNG